MHFAVVGSGISGLVSAYLLAKKHDVTLIESDHRLGGHTHTHEITENAQTIKIDTGFIVFNDWTYPNFIKLLNQLGVAYQKSDMSFSVKCAVSGLEYNGTNLNSLFAQRRNLFRPSFYRMIFDILRFNKEAIIDIQNDLYSSLTIGEYLQRKNFSKQFSQHYILPMGSAIWSAGQKTILDFPLKTFVSFFKNHGMLSVDDRPIWQVIKGGSSSYIGPLIESFKQNVLSNTKITAISRTSENVTIEFNDRQKKHFDAVVMACHSDQALKLLSDATAHEQEILGHIPYESNTAILHTDTRVLPQNKLAWAAWNYFIPQNGEQSKVAVTYNMNILQSLKTEKTYLVSLNMEDSIDPSKIIKTIHYHHPIYTQASDYARTRHHEINGKNRSYFCGAYWRNGFHEDGVWSALEALKPLGISL